MFQMLLIPICLAMAILLLVAAISVNPWNITLIVGFCWLCWPRKKDRR